MSERVQLANLDYGGDFPPTRHALEHPNGLLAVGGGFQLFDAFQCKGWKGILVNVLIGLIYLGAGLIIAIDPLRAAVALTLMLGIVVIVVGLTKVLSKTLAVGELAALLGVVIFVFGYMMFGGANSMVYTNTVQAVLMLVVDVSGSMLAPAGGSQTKWEVTRDALTDAVGELPATVAAGMLFYPNFDAGLPAPAYTEPQSPEACVDVDKMIPIGLLGGGALGQQAGYQSP